MKRTNTKSTFRLIVTGLFVLTALVWAQNALANSSAGATIHNKVTVTYTSGATTLEAYAAVDVTVNTKASLPTITNPAPQTVVSGQTVTYNYTITSTANGSDTYTTSLLTNTPTDVGAAIGPSITANVTLWGGIVIDSQNGGIIRVPGGSLDGNLIVNDTINLDGYGTFQVAGFAAGNAESTDIITGVTTPESYDTITLTPIAAPPISAGTIAVGTQAGEYDTITVSFDAATPTTAGTDGTYSTTFRVDTTAETVTGSGTTLGLVTAAVTTTVSSPSATITKQVRNVTAGGAFAAAGVTALPGEILEYQIVVTNNHATTSVTSVYIGDVVPAFTTLVTGAYNGAASEVQIDTWDDSAATTTTSYATSANDGDTAVLSGGTLTVTLGATAGDASVPTGGTLDALDSATVLFQVTVN